MAIIKINKSFKKEIRQVNKKNFVVTKKLNKIPVKENKKIIKEIEKIIEEKEKIIDQSFKIIIPARRNSKGFPFKNRYLFDNTIELLSEYNKKNIYVTTDDEIIKERAENLNINVISRPKKLSTDNVSMKDTIKHAIRKAKIRAKDNIMILYLTYPERKIKDINEAILNFKINKVKSLLCLEPVKTHPYMCLKNNNGKYEQLIKHDFYRRQDYPEIMEMSHYIIIIKANEIQKLNNQLFNDNTYWNKLGRRVNDVDYLEDFKKDVDFNTEMVKVIRMEKNINFINLKQIGEYFRNKRVCLVANSSLLKKAKLGKFIDDHDIVIRFNSFIIDEEYTGKKTNIHATVYLQYHNLDVPADIRIISSWSKRNWLIYINEKINENKQSFILDVNFILRDEKALSNVLNSGIVREKGRRRLIPTTGLNIISLLLETNTFKELNLVGFTFYDNLEKDMFRVDTDISEIHDYKFEKKYILKKFDKIDEFILTKKNENITL